MGQFLSTTNDQSTSQGGAVEGLAKEGRVVGVTLLKNGDFKYETKMALGILKWALSEHYDEDILKHLGIASVQTRLDLCKKLLLILLELHDEDIIHGSICSAHVKYNTGSVTLANAGLFAEVQRQVDHVPLLPCLRYRCKEMLKNDDYTPSKDGDLYALSVLIYAIFAGKEPYSNLNLQGCVLKIARVGHTGLEIPAMMPAALWRALKAYWRAGPEGREEAFGRIQAALA